MPPIPLKRILSFSSEDAIHKASNLLHPSTSLHWVSSTDHKAKRLTVELELAKSAKITQIEIGNFRSAFVEVLVSDNYMPDEGTDYVSLLPQSILMTAEESKNGRNTTRTKLFTQDKMSRLALDKKWKYIKIQCFQPFISNQPYGLRYIKIFQNSSIDSPSSESRTLTAKEKGGPSYSTPQYTRPKQEIKPFLTPQGDRRQRAEEEGIRTPKLPSLNVPIRGGNMPPAVSTPKRYKAEMECAEDSQEFEFAGLENQSRLLKNTLKGDQSLIDGNPILNRIANKKKSDTSQLNENEMKYVRRKLLNKELTAADNEPVDFMSSYSEGEAGKSRAQTGRMFSIMRKLDDSCEIGDETSHVHHRFGKRKANKRNGVSENDSSWIKRRGRKRKETKSAEFIDVSIKENIKQSKMSKYFKNIGEDNIEEESMKNPMTTTSSTDTTVTTTATGLQDGDVNIIVDDLTDEQEESMACPVCNELIPAYALELHATVCAERTFDNHQTNNYHNTLNDVIFID